ncbi:hypothetical protein [Gulosibacter chungangensis]|uniref:hypothetical protein n=1 Tax=Gulosibacter chungangensis TaxID=979746 RepID=UPI001787E6FF|nr:hypothetical protein [Gulosibacter chungangensis]
MNVELWAGAAEAAITEADLTEVDLAEAIETQAERIAAARGQVLAAVAIAN